jgi:hypothetical protein
VTHPLTATVLIFLGWSADLITIPQLRPLLQQIVEDGGNGFRDMEEAGFVTVHEGQFAIVRWSPAGEAFTGRWFGRLPEGALAIVHTHPNWQPMPSTIDARTAARTGLAVYVLTSTTITKTSGGTPQIVGHVR